MFNKVASTCWGLSVMILGNEFTLFNLPLNYIHPKVQKTGNREIKEFGQGYTNDRISKLTRRLSAHKTCHTQESGKSFPNKLFPMVFHIPT